MGSYLAAANKHIEDICSQIRGEERLSGPDDLRIAVSVCLALLEWNQESVLFAVPSAFAAASPCSSGT